GQPDAPAHGFSFASLGAVRRVPPTLGVNLVRLGRLQRKTLRPDINSYDSSFLGVFDERYAIDDR
ncbi:MAG: hypothetical protein KGJ99_10130, partial [Betaproteobacteria bacterium]|nr:hypothetical protein [Betaproteobacteria bacterium]